MSDKRRRAPRNLGVAGQKFWRRVLDDYELSPAEEAVLVQACRIMDLLERLEVEGAEQPLTEMSPQGRVVNPLLREARMQRQTLDRLVRSLGIPLVEGTSRGSRRGKSQEEPTGPRSFRVVDDEDAA
ncbi:terminase [Kocuria sp. U4B]